MTWVRVTSEQEAIVEVDLPLETSTLAELREAALLKLDESGGAEWDCYGGEVEATPERPLPFHERYAAERERRRQTPLDELIARVTWVNQPPTRGLIT